MGEKKTSEEKLKSHQEGHYLWLEPIFERQKSALRLEKPMGGHHRLPDKSQLGAGHANYFELILINYLSHFNKLIDMYQSEDK